MQFRDTYTAVHSYMFMFIGMIKIIILSNSKFSIQFKFYFNFLKIYVRFVIAEFLLLNLINEEKK